MLVDVEIIEKDDDTDDTEEAEEEGLAKQLSELTSADIDDVVDEVYADLVERRDEPYRLFDPETLDVGPRHYYVEYLDWLGIDRGALPHVWIHSGHPHHASLARASDPAQRRQEYWLYLRQRLYSVPDALEAAIAHELTHLYLLTHDRQRMPNTGAVVVEDKLTTAEEIRTDVASVVLGFGRLVLNGACAYADAYPSEQLGYLRPELLARTYQRVNDRAGVSSLDAREGLNELAEEAVK